jgi:hypothetical protein
MRTPVVSGATERFFKALGWLVGGILLGFALSKYSVRTAYQTGYDSAQEKYALHYKHQVKMFERHRDQSCMAYWFDDKPSRVAEARRWMCQYTNKNERLR